ncbi:DUF5606 family protein [Hymenobacter properus]|uniref:DUF5606 domain-containing protein n=1 Tax=Hymenobacter properus TaxID=2791026 RepID=A0A931BR20_9BACT|nr:DUF5606 domain-containing protein [Hymenobacter properus]MBF9144025.1 DUF5606 domain-containing protein [Hymenobacter properus]MBR7722842.1 DUF5606 domain-containing protein [Microvirga sp. SRT04]
MPYELQELAAISGMPGLYRLVRAARHGVLVESLDEKATRTLAPARNKVSLLSEISIYTQDPDQTVPLTEVFERIYQKHGAASPVTSKSSEGELTDFLAGVIPDYDRDRVYLSDIKKLANWYGIVSKHRPYQAAAEAPATEAPATEASATEAPAPEAAAEAPAAKPAPKAKRKSAKATEEPAANEPLSTGGVIGETDAASTAEGNPEAVAPAKKSRKKAE